MGIGLENSMIVLADEKTGGNRNGLGQRSNILGDEFGQKRHDAVGRRMFGGGINLINQGKRKMIFLIAKIKIKTARTAS